MPSRDASAARSQAGRKVAARMAGWIFSNASHSSLVQRIKGAPSVRKLTPVLLFCERFLAT